MRVDSRWMMVVAVVAGAGLLWGCNGSDNGGENGLVFPQNQNQEEDAGQDVDEVPDPCDGVECEAGEVCVEGVCQGVADPGYSCAEPYDLGRLSGGVTEQNANPLGQPDLMRTGCAAVDGSAEAVFRFEVAQPSRLRIDIDRAFEDIPVGIMAKEIRQGSCVSAEAAVECSINPIIFDAEVGQEYFLVVEMNNDPENINEFKLEIEVEELACSPPGARTCRDGESVLCFGGTEERVSQCVGECANDEECAGTRCETAIEVRGSGTYTGEYGAYQNRFDFSDSPSCSTEGTTGVNTPGRDVVFSLPGLQQGQTVTVEKGDLGLAVLAVMSDCAESEAVCVVGDTTAGTLSWEVAADGDYFVVISPRTTVSGAFEYGIEID